MQTIAGLAERLDMSADQAVETLKTLHFDVEGVQSEISDEQIDMLIDVDEDPAALDRYLKEIEKQEEKKRKRAENLRKAAKKAAAKRKAKAKAKPKAKAKTKAEPEEKPAAAEQPVAEKEEKEAAAEPEVVQPEPAPAPETMPAGEQAEEVGPVSEEQAKAEPAPEEAPAAAEAPAAEEAPAAAEAPAAEEAPAAAEAPAAEATPTAAADVEPADTVQEEVPAVKETEILKSQEVVEEQAEILPPEAPIQGAVKAERKHEAQAEKGSLAEAERRHEEAARKKAGRMPMPAPMPDPDVVAAVIRRDQERGQERQVKEKAKTKAKTKGKEPETQKSRVQEVPDFPQPDRGKKRPKSGAAASKTGKTARKRQKRAERMRNEETLRREANQLVREFEAGGFDQPRKKKRRKRFDETGQEDAAPPVIHVHETMTVEELANATDFTVNDIILELMDEDVLATKNHTLEIDVIRKLMEKHGYEVRAVIPEEVNLMTEEPDAEEDLELRAPVVTVMGHVDHGKTSFLDVVRKANVAGGEAGGITQHIAAYDVNLDSGRLVFLDTPGHEAFTQMRARGAGVTDIVVLVVAADDGVRPQTLEAISHAKEAEVPVVVAINKIDKPEAQPDRVRQELANRGLVDDSWGGDTIIKEISAITKEGIDELLELLVLQAESMELKANPKKRGRGAVIESEMTVGLGPVAWVLVQTGTLRVGDSFLCGETSGRVRTMTNAMGKQIDEAGPASPVLITGFTEPPNAGDQFVAVEDERTARSVAEQRSDLRRQKEAGTKRVTLEDFHALIQAGEQKSLKVVVKADVQGSIDALNSSLQKLGNEEVNVNIIHTGVGGVNESDVMLASASDAVIIGFHVTANARIKKLAEQEGVEIRTYRIIYECLEEVQKALEGMLAPEKREVVTGHAQIRQVFRSSALGNIAGCYVQDGEIMRASLARILRDDVVVYEGKIASLRRERDDVRSVASGYECGIKVAGFDDVKEDDIIEAFRIEEVAKTFE
ncbi:MAG: translation initiation factor IF-2 [Candidatus Hydrogenedentota bacterium]